MGYGKGKKRRRERGEDKGGKIISRHEEVTRERGGLDRYGSTSQEANLTELHGQE